MREHDKHIYTSGTEYFFHQLTGILTDTVTKAKIAEARRMGHDINVKPSSRVNMDTQILTIVSDDKTVEYEVAAQDVFDAGLR